ncbi:hypothetical protein WN51_11033 [Melipona quadrifasciata]|uniref:Uncharacterized protein n=1 Tax=Melipona quadrifasciata TaxID=166423 RepID=A0A0M9A3U5_9HYME|nr:hypothetical protein WN51_11033 [Melipona quadrifasciata]
MRCKMKFQSHKEYIKEMENSNVRGKNAGTCKRENVQTRDYEGKNKDMDITPEGWCKKLV